MEYIGFTYIQPVSKYSATIVKLRRVIAARKSKYQFIEIIELEEFGRCLVLDYYIQSSEVDEYIYHESLVHPVMVAHPNPQRVLIIGGGEGATLREVLKHKTVKEAVMVDIDEDVIEMAKKYLPTFHAGAFDDPRTKLVITDGREFIKKVKTLYDVIILDLTDPYSSQIAKELYSKGFYSYVFKRLKDDGIMVTQAGNSFFFQDVYEYVVDNVRQVFPIVNEYAVWIPSFGYAVNYVVGSKKYDPSKLSIEYVDKVLKGRGVKTRFYSGRAHLGMMLLPIIKVK